MLDYTPDLLFDCFDFGFAFVDTVPLHAQCQPRPSTLLEFRLTLDCFCPSVTQEAWQDFPLYASLYSQVRATTSPNYLKAKVPVPSGLNISTWRQMLVDYPDLNLVDHLECGWVLDYTAAFPPVPTFMNHARADDIVQRVAPVLVLECSLGGMIGPFCKSPFKEWYQLSLLMKRPKKDSSKKRIIMDLSFPLGKAVNAGILKRFFQCKPFSFTLPSVTTLTDRLVLSSPSSFLWSADLLIAYQQLHVCPLSFLASRSLISAILILHLFSGPGPLC